MFHRSSKLNHRFNSIHERALRVTYQNYKLTWTVLELLQKDNSVTIHQRNLEVLATEIFKAKNDLSLEIIKEVFEFQEPSYSLRSQGNYFVRGNVRTTHYGIQSIKYLAPKKWGLVSDQIKNCGSITKLKNFIKSWSPSDCPVLVCYEYIYCASRLHLIRHNESKWLGHYNGECFCNITLLFQLFPGFYF